MSFLKPAAHLLRICKIQQIGVLGVKETRSIKRWVAPTMHELYKRRQKIGPEPEKPRSTFLEWNYNAEIFAFGKRLSEEFNKDILKQAFIHREYANIKEIEANQKGLHEPKLNDNLDLIKQGDQIISQYIKDFYKNQYPDDIVTSVHNYLMSTEMLSHVAKHMGIGDLVLSTEFPLEDITLANTFKAIVAALKESQNISRAQLLVKDFLLCQMVNKDVYEIWNPKEPYEYLTSLLKERDITDIEIRICNASAVNTVLANYEIGIYNNKSLLGIGCGENINIAKDIAALNAIQKIFNTYVQK